MAAKPDLKRKSLAETDPGDRAQSMRKPGQLRVNQSAIVFSPPNRGHLGVSGHHTHEVAWDCLSNGIKLKRYNAIDVVEVPMDELASFRKENAKKARDDPLLPNCDGSKLLYAALTKPHFLHTGKLGSEKGRYLFNEQQI